MSDFWGQIEELQKQRKGIAKDLKNAVARGDKAERDRLKGELAEIDAKAQKVSENSGYTIK